MLWFIIAFVIALMLGFAVALDDFVSTAVFVFFCTALIAGAVALGINGLFIGVGDKTHQATGTVANLENMRDGQGIHGAFFLGSGVVNSYPEYTYYTHDDNGGYSLHTLDADGQDYTVQVFQDNSTPRLDCVYTEVTHKPGHWLSVFPDSNGDCTAYQFHVPPGSIVNDFVLGK